MPPKKSAAKSKTKRREIQASVVLTVDGHERFKKGATLKTKEDCIEWATKMKDEIREDTLFCGRRKSKTNGRG